MVEQAQKYAYKCKMEFLSTSEAAAYVRLGERKLYELVTSGAIPCSKAAGKWLFPRQELDLWVLSGLARPAGMIAADSPPIVGGSQDDLLEWTLRESGSGLASLAEGTVRGVERLQRGEVIAAAIHFHSDAISADSAGDANIAAVPAIRMCAGSIRHVSRAPILRPRSAPARRTAASRRAPPRNPPASISSRWSGRIS